MPSSCLVTVSEQRWPARFLTAELLSETSASRTPSTALRASSTVSTQALRIRPLISRDSQIEEGGERNVYHRFLAADREMQTGLTRFYGFVCFQLRTFRDELRERQK